MALTEPDLLLLDEPTNHLDLDVIEWLEDWLVRYNKTLLLVTHDRYFLDRICTHILELDDASMYKHKGTFTDYLEARDVRMTIQNKTADKAQNLLRTELEWARRMPKARGTKAKYRLDALQDLKKASRDRVIQQDMALSVKSERIGKKILEVESVRKAFDSKVILQDFSYTFKRGDKIGIIGENGVGKSTFLKLLLGQEPADQGQIHRGKTIKFGHLEQQGKVHRPDDRVIDTVLRVAEYMEMADGSTLSASQLLGKFLFPVKQQQAKVHTLSGGETKRLDMLLTLVANPNFLVLDEPTNDLDVFSIAVLEDFLQSYRGCLLVVSHDRYFMDKILDELFVFEGEGVIRPFNGTYSAYLQQEKEAEAERKEQRDRSGKQAAAERVKTVKRSYKENQEFEKLQTDIEALEQEQRTIEEQLQAEALPTDQVVELSKVFAQNTSRLEEMEMRWLELSELEA